MRLKNLFHILLFQFQLVQQEKLQLYFINKLKDMYQEIDGVIYNASNLQLQFIVYDADESVIGNQNGINNFQTAVDEVKFKGFYKKVEIVASAEHQGKFIPIKVEDKPRTDVRNDDLSKKKFSVRAVVGDYVKYVIKDKLIEYQQDMCIRIRPNLSWRQLDEQEIWKYLDQPQQEQSQKCGGDYNHEEEDNVGSILKQKYSSEQLYNVIYQGLKRNEEERLVKQMGKMSLDK